ncbi:MAG: hypothetical protein JW928_01720 [Candidatus Aureabacteria bacterium]|nr:hypothetical protein [Candidatus Auribacterota bacterium]
MLGCILFTIGTLSIYTVYTAGEKSRYYAAQRVKALYLVKGVIQILEAQDYENIVPRENIVLKDFEEFSLAIRVHPQRTLSKSFEIAKEVSVEAAYDVQGEKQSVSLVTLFYPPS